MKEESQVSINNQLRLQSQLDLENSSHRES